jgi:hypothetical protein
LGFGGFATICSENICQLLPLHLLSRVVYVLAPAVSQLFARHGHRLGTMPSEFRNMPTLRPLSFRAATPVAFVLKFIATRWLRFGCLPALLLGLAPACWAQTIPNASFESNTFAVFPGYASGNGGTITGWTLSDAAGIGLNPAGVQKPFADNGAIPNGANVAFIQAVNNTNTLSTTITGLTVGRNYAVSFRANCRASTGVPNPTWSLNGGAFVPFTAAPAVGGPNAYYTNTATFTATATTAALALRNGTTADTTVLLDAFSIQAAPTIPNPSFEIDAFDNPPGYASQNGGSITGWTISNPNFIGLSIPNLATYVLSEGAPPDGYQVAFVQANGNTNTLSTIITGLTVGQTYGVSFRAGHVTTRSVPGSTWSLNGGPFVPFSAELTSTTVWPISAFCTNLGFFTATATTAVLALRNGSASDSALLLDDFSVGVKPTIVTTGPATNVTLNSATLNGTVNPGGLETGYYFQYGATTNYGSVTGMNILAAGSGTNSTTTQTLGGLTPVTTYHFRIVATNSSGTYMSADRTFFTAIAPTVVTQPASSLSNSVATLNGTINPNGLSTLAWLEWGTNAGSYAQQTAPVALGNSFTNLALSSNLSGLTPGVIYHCRVAASNAVGIVRGGDVRFGSPMLVLNGGTVLTNECHMPFVDPGATASWGDNNNGELYPLSVSGTVDANSPGSYLLTYASSNFLGGVAAPVTRTVVVQDTLPPVLTTLGANPLVTAYLYPFVDPGATAFDACGGILVVSTNSNVNVNARGSYTVTYTTTDPSGNSTTNTRTVVVEAITSTVTLPASGVSNTVARLNGTVNPGGVPTIAWFEWSGAAANPQKTAPVALGSGLTTLALSNNLAGLAPGAVYHYCMVASNVAGITRGKNVWFGSPAVELNGGAVLTNECHFAFTDPGASSSLVPRPIAAETYDGLVLKSDGKVVIWGQNSLLYNQTNVPAGLSNVVAIAGGDIHSLALRSDGTVVGWGGNNFGQANIPAGLSNVAAIAAGSIHNVALKNDGTVTAWASNLYGQTNVPAGLSNVVAIACGANHSLALKRDGTVVGWGDNSHGQTNIPPGLSNVTAIAAGQYHSMALTSDGTVVVWGGGAYGETNIPPGLSNVIAIGCGSTSLHCLAVKNDGTVVTWGFNDSGGLLVPAGLSNVVAVTAGTFHSMALKSDGRLFAWGTPLFGLTNVPSVLNTPSPVASGDMTVSGNLDTNSPGTYQLTYTITNVLGGISTITRTVLVQDTLPPVLTLNGPSPLLFANDNRLFTDPGATALDACAGLLPVSVATNTVNVNFPGTYSITYRSTDSSGNSSTLTRTVAVTLPPKVPGDINGDGIVSQPELDAVYASYVTNSPWLRMTNVAGLGGTNVTFNLPNSIAGGYSVQYSTNLVNWIYLGPATPRYLFTDTNAPSLPQRYYRLTYP